jgi:hypothetical protein
MTVSKPITELSTVSKLGRAPIRSLSDLIMRRYGSPAASLEAFLSKRDDLTAYFQETSYDLHNRTP